MPKKQLSYDYDVIVIGAGSAGFTAAETARSAGASVLVVEKDVLGGECPNWACVPTKALLKCARVYDFAKHHLDTFGVQAKNVRFSFARMMDRKDAVVDVITGDGQKLRKFAQERGIDVEMGEASFVDEHTVKIGSRKRTAKAFVIATGTKVFIPPIDGLEDAGYMTFRDAVSLESLPPRIAIIGGGPVACEFATFFSMLDSNVILLQLSDRILDREDPEISTIAAKELASRGTTILTNTKTLSVYKEGRSKKKVTFQVGEGKRRSIVVDAILVAAGKRPDVRALNLEKIGVKMDKKGQPKVTQKLYTNKSHIFAAGDVAGGLQFTHTAHTKGHVAGVNAVQKDKRKMQRYNPDVIPRVTFVEPEVASVGLTVEQAEEKHDAALGRFPVGALGRAVTEGERVGLLKLVADKKSGNVLGGHMVGSRAGEVIHEVALAMYANMKMHDLAEMIHAFPTFSEAVPNAAAGSE